MAKFNVLLMTAAVLAIDGVENEQQAAHEALLVAAKGEIDSKALNWFVKHVTDKDIVMGTDPEFSEAAKTGESVDVKPFTRALVNA